MRHLFSVFAIALLLGGCSFFQSHTEVEALNEAKLVGSMFTQRLAGEYKEYMNSKRRALDYEDTKHFARKGFMAAQGKAVMPEPLSNWHLSKDAAQELGNARVRLLRSLDAGGRAMAPAESALAQAKFDCWVEETEDLWPGAGCKPEFEKAIADLENRMRSTVPPSDKLGEPVPPRKTPVKDPEPQPEPEPEAVPSGLDEGMFLVFFDFDQSSLTASGMEVIDAVATQASRRNDLVSIAIIGHADTSGSDSYNQRLSMRRAAAVREALSQRGVATELLQTEGRGESQLMVPTANDTREPANRRVEVQFQ